MSDPGHPRKNDPKSCIGLGVGIIPAADHGKDVEECKAAAAARIRSAAGSRCMKGAIGCTVECEHTEGEGRDVEEGGAGRTYPSRPPFAHSCSRPSPDGRRRRRRRRVMFVGSYLPPCGRRPGMRVRRAGATGSLERKRRRTGAERRRSAA